MKKFLLIMLIMFILCGCSAEKYDVEENADVAVAEVFEEDEVFVSENDTFEIEEVTSGEASTEQINTVVSTEEVVATEEKEVEEEKISYDIIGNKNSKKYHLPSCHTLPHPKNQVFFESSEEAANSGYKPCKNCRP